ncbi:MAG: GNAT family N-acetyltransferase [Rhizobiales bacterium]|nr:GNAT family N-acetyltransferase [Hyphomicrobiales bacterium]
MSGADGSIPLALDGYTDLPPGHIANVVTYFEQRSPADRPGHPLPEGLAIAPMEPGRIDRYLAIYRRIGHDWMWFSRLAMPAPVLAARLADPACAVSFLMRGDEIVGLCEIRRAGSDVEVAMFGVVAEETGTGAAKGFLSAMLQACWQPPTERVWLHTCTYDHPAAVHFYARMGFRPFKFAIEVTSDPRLHGILPATAGPHVPLIRP